MRSPGCRGQDGQTAPVPALGALAAFLDCGVPQGGLEGGQWAACPQGACSVADRDSPRPRSLRLASLRAPITSMLRRLCQKE